MTFASNLATGDVIDFVQILGNVLDLGQPSDDTVTAAKLNNNVISGQTELASEPADTDEFLVSDAGTIKRIDYSLIKGISGLGHSAVYLPGDIAISGNGYLTQSGASAALTINNASAAGTGIVTSTTDGHITLDKTGFYLVIYQMNANASSGNDVFNMYIRTWNGSSESNVGYSYLAPNSSDDDTVEGTCVAIVDVDNTSNVKLHMGYAGASNITLRGTGQSVTSMTIIRLGDT